MESTFPLRYLVAGSIRRDFRILPGATPKLDVPGGSLLYAAAGIRVWDHGIGLVSRVGRDLPAGWLETIQGHELDTRGIYQLPEPIDIRHFVGYTEAGDAQSAGAVGQFARLGYAYPKELLGYSYAPPEVDSRTGMSPLAIRASQIPADYLDASAAHICPMDFLAQQLLPLLFRQGQINTITLDPSPGYMNPIFWNDMPRIVKGLTAFITSEQKLCSLFQGKTEDVWEMAAGLVRLGCEMVVVQRGSAGQLLYDGRTRWLIPAYPVRAADPTGENDAFAGGFLAGWRTTYDPLRAVLMGNIASSLTVESSDVFYAMDSMPGLAEARIAALERQVRVI